ncbi:MAG: hypothetical protein NXH85_18295 [Pseudomonadaceae bacterium]|nr:hypothetical protein [Pseudomonadaceae bacterium]
MVEGLRILKHTTTNASSTTLTLKVIGAGFGRTGTASLKMALELLLDAPCYHMSEVIGKSGHVDHWLDAAAGNPDWPAIFEGYVATVDFPASNYWRQLAEFYPDAKIILSLRDAARWYESTQETIFSKKLQAFQSGTKWGRMCKATIDDHLGGDINDREAVIAAFNEHNEEVKRSFASDRVLVFEAKHGWQPLCQFLDVPVPTTDYPHINSKEEFDGVFELLNSPLGARVTNGEGLPDGPIHEELLSRK